MDLRHTVTTHHTQQASAEHFDYLAPPWALEMQARADQAEKGQGGKR